MLYVQKYPRSLFIAPERDVFLAHGAGHAFRQLGARHLVGYGRVPDEERVDRRGAIGGAVTDNNLFAGHVNCCFVPVPNRFLLAYGRLQLLPLAPNALKLPARAYGLIYYFHCDLHDV